MQGHIIRELLGHLFCPALDGLAVAALAERVLSMRDDGFQGLQLFLRCQPVLAVGTEPTAYLPQCLDTFAQLLVHYLQSLL